jgi:hypothetical protein
VASEPAFLTYLFCLRAQPKPDMAEMRWLANDLRRPKGLCDHEPEQWLPAREHCRRLLPELVAHELAPLRAREAWLREYVEGPARGPDAVDLVSLRAERLHEQAFHRRG